MQCHVTMDHALCTRCTGTDAVGDSSSSSSSSSSERQHLLTIVRFFKMHDVKQNQNEQVVFPPCVSTVNCKDSMPCVGFPDVSLSLCCLLCFCHASAVS